MWWNDAVDLPDTPIGIASGKSAPRTAVPASSGSRLLRRALAAAAWVLGAVAGFFAYLRLARTLAVNSDGASQALQAWDMLHGNVLLRGWTVGDVNFYTTELPEYMLVELVRGLNQDVVHVAAALTYTLAVLLAALLAKGTSTGLEAAARVLIAVGIMLAPQLDGGILTVLSSPDHFGTSVPVLLAWLIADRARPRWYVPVVTSVILGLAVAADLTAFYIGVLPLVIVCAVRVGRAKAGGQRLAAQWHDIALGAGALAGAAAALFALRILETHGFRAWPAATSLSPVGTIAQHNLGMTGDGLLLLGGADFLVWPFGVTAVFIVLHIVGVFIGACGIALAAWRFPRERDLVAQVLLVGIVINLAAYLVGTRAGSLADTREITGVLPFGAALAGRLLGPRLAGARLTGTGPAGGGLGGRGLAGRGLAGRGLAGRGLARRFVPAALVVVLPGYLAGLGLELTTPTVPAQAQQLASWLEARHLSTGLSGFWPANVVTLTTGQRVNIRPVRIAGGRVYPNLALQKADWYNPADTTANFVVLYPGVAGYPGGLPGYAGFMDMRTILAVFGKPASTYSVGSSTVLVWNKNILTDLG